MNKRLKILIAVLVGLGLVFIYVSYLSDNGDEGNKAIVVLSDNGGMVETMPFSEGKEVLKMLDVLRAIDLDTAFFNDEIFLGLIDFSVELMPEKAGRPNPFAPLEILD